MELALVNNLTSLVLWPNETFSDYYDLDSNTSAVNISSAAESNDGPYPKVQAVLDFLNLYYLGALIIVGLLGNGKNVVAFILNRNELRSPSYYLASLALADVVFLITILFLWLGQFKIYLFTQAGFYQTLFYLSSVSSCVSAWMIAAFTFERLIVVRYPLKRAKICTVRRAKIIIFCLTAGAFIFQVVSLFPTSLIDKKGKRTNTHFYYEMKRFLSMLETAYTLVIPPVIIVFLNGFIIHDLFQFNQTFQSGSSKHRSTRRTNGTHQENIQMKPFTETKRIEQDRLPYGGVVSGDEGVKTITEPNSRVTMPGHHNNSSSSGSSSNNNANQCNINTLAIVEDRQCSSPSVDYLNLPMTRSPQPLSMASSSLTSNAVMCHNLIKESISSSVNVSKNNDEISQRRETAEDAIAILPNQQPQSIAASVSVNDMSGDAIKEASESPEIIIIQPLNMDAIEMDNLSPPASTVDKIASKMNTSTDVDIEQNQESILTRICKELKLKRSKKSPTSTEYSITKKLVLISTVHILLNLPSYVFHLKNFIDENIASGSNAQMTWTIWYLQQFSMVLYYTSFAINFLLYPNSSNFNFNLKFIIKRCWRMRQTETVLSV